MFRKTAFLGLLIATIALFGSGCCDEQSCQDKFGTTCSEESCRTTYPPPETPVGPDITLEDDGDPNTNTLQWNRNGSPLGANSLLSVFPATWPDKPCVLRGDFFGTRSANFDFFYPSIGPVQDADKVTVSSSLVEITIERGPWDTMRWTIKEKTGKQRICRPWPTTNYDAHRVPKELGGLKKDTLRDAANALGTKVEFSVETPS